MYRVATEELPLFVNPSVRPEDEVRLSRQARQILFRLLDGFLPVPTNDDLIKLSRKYTGRISEIRTAVEKLGFKLEAKDLGGGPWEYTIKNELGERVVGNRIIKLLRARSRKPILWD